jgi:hypothetical protein
MVQEFTTAKSSNLRRFAVPLTAFPVVKDVADRLGQLPAAILPNSWRKVGTLDAF